MCEFYWNKGLELTQYIEKQKIERNNLNNEIDDKRKNLKTVSELCTEKNKECQDLNDKIL